MSEKIHITLPDGKQLEYASSVTGAKIAEDISKSLAKAAFACVVDDKLVDLSEKIEKDSAVRIVTLKDESTALSLIRHDCAHIMARAVQELYPETKVTIGPVIRNGFYYDFDRATPFTDEDLEKIQERMTAIIAARDPIRCEAWDRAQAIEYYKKLNEPYKVELVENIPETEDIKMYWHGHWQDLCRGPHLVHTGQIPPKSFKLTHVSGAYWRGDSSRPMLQRIYGTAWLNANDLLLYTQRREEALARDHRRLGKEMELFHLQEESPGMVFWHPHGWTLWLALESYMRNRLESAGYQEVKTPQLVDRTLWEKSGHWEKFRQSMFIAEVNEEKTKRISALKPMNCPCHVQIFNQSIRSYRQLPLRMAEFGSCHRYEPSGAMHGLMRVRGFTQDDAHIFCTENQIASETKIFIDLLADVYSDLGFDTFNIRFSDRPTVRTGTDSEWDKAEQALVEATEAAGYSFTLNPGEGAFYGPKLEFILTDAIGREWQCGTLQVDFVLPERLDAKYVDESGAFQRPVILHRAILGSFERFLGILIEHYGGKFPLWLAPCQVAVATIVSEVNNYAEHVVSCLRARKIRVEMALRNEKISYKIRELSTKKIPVILVIGQQEAEKETVTIRRLGEQGNEQRSLPLDEVLDLLESEVTPPG